MVKVAAADSLLGMLQRGRGVGFQIAVDDPAAARALVVRCVVADPRVDWQVEDRANYYGELAVAIDLDVAPLYAHLFSEEDARVEGRPRTGLTLAVLGNMAERGRYEAISVLREYVERGWNWEWAIEDLWNVAPSATDGLASVISNRLNDAQLADAATFFGGPAWEKLVAENARLAQARSRRKRDHRSSKEDPRPTADLLEDFRGSLALRDRRGDAEMLRNVVRNASSTVTARRNALIALGYMNDVSFVGEAEAALSDPAERVSNAAWRYFMGLLKHGPVPVMRAWVDRRGTDHQRLAAHMLGDWGSDADIPTIRALLDDFWPDGDLYTICSLVEGLGRIGDSRDIAILLRVYEQADYSYLRTRAARGLARLSPTFSRGLAVECLWDCEDSTRVLGCERVELSGPSTRNRVTQLASSLVEDETVRVAAAARLA